MTPPPSPADVIRLIHRLYDLADRLWDVFGEVVEAHERERRAARRPPLIDRPCTLSELDPF